MAHCTASVPFSSFMREECESHLRFIDEQVLKINWTPSESAASWTSTNRRHILHLISKAAAVNVKVNVEKPATPQNLILLSQHTAPPPLSTQTSILPSECCTNCSLGRIGVVSGAFSGFLLILHTYLLSAFQITLSLSLLKYIGLGEP